jgi:hypothetical protein
MKKFILTLSILLAWIYLSNFISAIVITKNSWEVLDNTTWTNISNLTNKIDVSSSDIKLNWQLYVTWKLCDNSWKCLWEKIWTENSPWTNCKTILADEPSYLNQDWEYWIKPDWYAWSAFKTLCDMTTDWWGRTIISNINDTKRAIWIRNWNVTNIPDLSTFWVINSTTWTALYNWATAILFKSWNYKYSITNSSTALSCLKWTTVSYQVLHNWVVAKLWSSTLTVPRLDYLWCNISWYDGWRFWWNESSSRESKQAFNNYYNWAAIIVNWTRNTSHTFTVWVR